MEATLGCCAARCSCVGNITAAQECRTGARAPACIRPRHAVLPLPAPAQRLLQWAHPLPGLPPLALSVANVVRGAPMLTWRACMPAHYVPPCASSQDRLRVAQDIVPGLIQPPCSSPSLLTPSTPVPCAGPPAGPGRRPRPERGQLAQHVVHAADGALSGAPTAGQLCTRCASAAWPLCACC